MWFVYILQTKNKQLYTGMTNNIDRRMKQHKSGRGARFTRIFGFKKLLYAQTLATRSEALKRECEIKRWPKAKKIKLVSSILNIEIDKVIDGSKKIDIKGT